MKRIVFGLLSIAVFVSLSNGQPRVFIAPMEEGFDSFLAAAMIDNNVPVVITVDECIADYVITGQGVKGQNRWYDVVFGAERDRNQGSIRLVNVSEKSVVWAGAAGDRSLWWGALKSGGQKKVANRLAREIKKGYFNRVIPAGTSRGCESNTNGTNSAATSQNAGPVVEVKSVPEGAEIYVNNEFVGNTPSKIQLKAGENTITVKKPGFRNWDKFVRLGRQDNITLTAELARY